MMWQGIQDFLTQEWVTTVLVKAGVVLGILLTAAVVAKVTAKVINRWQNFMMPRLQKRDPGGYSSISTKFTIIKRLILGGVYGFAFILIFLQFEALRSIGTGLLASAGLAGIVIGMAAQSTLADIVAGVAVSFAQPVRLNDAVIFDGEFGWIEEIALMHTVIKTWDNRRIVVPNSVLINKVVQNWTMKDPSLLGAVMLYVDYTCDVDLIKKWVSEIVEASEFSGPGEKVAGVQIVDFTERSMVLRILSKGPDAPRTWNLRCEIRDKLIRRFREHGLPYPRIRLEGWNMPSALPPDESAGASAKGEHQEAA